MEECLKYGEEIIIERMKNSDTALSVEYSCRQMDINGETIYYLVFR